MPDNLCQVLLGCSLLYHLSYKASQAEFPSASAVLDGFGGADLTISKLRKKLRSWLFSSYWFLTTYFYATHFYGFDILEDQLAERYAGL